MQFINIYFADVSAHVPFFGPSDGAVKVIQQRYPSADVDHMKCYIILTYLLTPWCRILFEKLIVT